MNNFDSTNLSEEVCELLDLYVFGALDEKETAQAKNILSVSSNARSYVDEQRAVLTKLETDAPSNPVLFDSIKAAIKTNAETSMNSVTSISSAASKKATTSGRLSYMAIAASILAVVISVSLIAFSGDRTNTNSTASKKMDMKEQMTIFSSQKSTSKMALANADGVEAVEVMMNDSGEVMIDGRKLDSLSKSETYQLWAIISDATPGSNGVKIISASVLGNDPSISMTHIDGDVKGFAVTREVAGGVAKSNNKPMYAHMLA